MPLVNVDLLVRLVEGLLKDLNVLVVLFTLHHELLHVAFLLLEDLDGLLVATALFVKLALKVVDLNKEKIIQEPFQKIIPRTIPKDNLRTVPKDNPIIIPKDNPRTIPKDNPRTIPKDNPRTILR